MSVPQLKVADCKRCDTCMFACHTGDGQVYDCLKHENLSKAPKSYHVCDDWIHKEGDAHT